ncbi:MAG: T9SS type A sorting domain-containing protein, partial [Bacteroidota bacterium]
TGPSTTYTYSYTDGNGCSATSAAATITVNPLPVVTAGNVSGCAGSAIALSGSPSGGTFSVADPYTGPSTTYTYSYTDGNGCSNTSAAATITVNPLPTVSFTGLAATYNVSASAATLTGSPAGGTFSGPGISGNTFTPASAGVGGPYTIVYSYTDGNGCSNSASHQTTVTNCTLPGMPGTINTIGGAVKVCSGMTVTYTCPVASGATSYTWTPPTGGVVVSGQGTRQIVINYTAGFTTSGTLSVVANNACGSGPARTLTITRNTPSAPSIITGQAYGACNGSAIPYSVTNAAGVTFNWSFNTGNATIATGQGTNAITVNFSGAYVSGTLSVTASNGCATSAARNMVIRAFPSVPGSITGASTVCAHQFGVSYSIIPVTYATIYTWQAPNGCHISDGVTTSPSRTLITTATSVTVNFGGNAGNVVVKAGNACGYSAFSVHYVSFTCRMAEENQFDASVYPNPSEGDFTITVQNGADEKTAINVMDATGRLVQNIISAASNSQIQLSNLLPGVYSAVVTNGDNRKVLKLIKVN